MNAIKPARKKAKMTQAALAQAIGATRATVCRYEKGLRLPDMKFARALNEVLGIPLPQLRPDLFNEAAQ